MLSLTFGTSGLGVTLGSGPLELGRGIIVRHGVLNLGHVRCGELHLEQLWHVYRSKVTVQPHLGGIGLESGPGPGPGPGPELGLATVEPHVL